MMIRSTNGLYMVFLRREWKWDMLLRHSKFGVRHSSVKTSVPPRISVVIFFVTEF